MCLTIYIKEDDTNIDKKVITDVEKEFSKLTITGTDIEKQLISCIEQGEYIDNTAYKDRFGYKLHYDDMSTGCKAALCVVNIPNCIIDLTECGLNARDAIVTLCKTGNIIIANSSITFKTIRTNDVIDVNIDSYNITSLKRLNTYIQDERPFEPDLSTGGIKCLS